MALRRAALRGLYREEPGSKHLFAMMISQNAPGVCKLLLLEKIEVELNVQGGPNTRLFFECLKLPYMLTQNSVQYAKLFSLE